MNLARRQCRWQVPHEDENLVQWLGGALQDGLIGSKLHPSRGLLHLQ